jgi:hypothetical protein
MNSIHDSGHRRRRSIRPLVLAAVLIVAAGAGVAPASAEPFGGEPGGYPWRADSADHWYCFYNIAEGNRGPYHGAMANLDSQTRMYDVFTPTCGAATDIMYLNNPNLGSGVFGMALCMTLVPGSSTVCDAYWVATNNWEYVYWLGPGYAPADVHVNQNVRHETGHTAGLTHSNTTVSAMRSGMLPDLGGYNFVWGAYTTHHIGHIDGAYL